ncbi:MAG: radical SAM protein [Alphaproteobacteria bacterium]|nr:radical SAM protein [Alphaproteobacteria bacterium]MBF0128505.1 radical SAM protein [Alphaproteobacteria bacterium]
MSELARGGRRGGAASHEPGYVRLLRSGELGERVRRAVERLGACDLCARRCGCDRTQGKAGAVCRTGRQAVVHSFGPHHGEEDCLRGWNGSGTIFFSHCNLRCVFCQNWDISIKGHGVERTAEELAGLMLRLQEHGCHNINLVSPSHVVAQILEAVLLAAGRGLRLPLVYNSGGHDSLEGLELLDGVVDIYMPDMKYGDDETARRCSKVRGYVEANRAAVREMHRQVGDLTLGQGGLALRGLLIRHLVLPDGLAGTREVARFVEREISGDSAFNLMDQYRPCHRAAECDFLDRRVTPDEFSWARQEVATAGLNNILEGSAWLD